MPFIAVCPHCLKGKFRVPTKKRGQPETCPKCHQHFLLLPEGESAAVDAGFYHLPDPIESDDSSEQPPTLLSDTSDSTEATATAAPATATTTPELTPAPPVIIVRHAAPAPSSGEYTVPEVFAFVGGMLFGFGMIATLLPYGRILAAVFALLGVGFGGLSLLGLEAKRWLGWASLGLNAFALVALAILPDWLGVGEWIPPPTAEAAAVVTAVSRDGRQTAVPAEWVDAGQAVWQLDDVRMQVVAATIAPLDPMAKKLELRKEKVLRIKLSITNVGVARAIEFQGWATNPMAMPILTTADGQSLAMRSTESSGSGPVYPGKSADATLVFAVPTGTSELKLELPAAAFGGTEPVRFRVPSTLFTR